jgi:sensor domain CHASE-containing protein
LKLLYKTILVALAVIAVFSAALYFLSSAFIARSYDKLESDTVIKDLQRVKYAIDDRLTALGKSAADWAVWDNSYNFVHDQNQSYIDLTLTDLALVSAGFNFIAYFDLADQLLYSKFIDLNTLKSIPLTEADIRQLNAFYHSSDNYLTAGISGIVRLNHGAIMVASYPVLHSDRSGPANGVLLKGRLLNTNELGAIAHSTQLVLSMQPYIDMDMRGLSNESLSPLIMNGDYFISKTNLESLNAYKIIDDYNGQPCLVVQTIILRDIFNEGRNTIYWIHAVLLTLSIVFVVMTSILIYQMIISRVKKLTSGLQKVSERNDLTIRMPVIGNDEISTLTRQTNSTLDKIAKTQFELKSSEDRFRKISEVAQDLIYQFALQPELVIEYISPSVEKILGYSVAEVTRDSNWLLKTI